MSEIEIHKRLVDIARKAHQSAIFVYTLHPSIQVRPVFSSGMENWIFFQGVVYLVHR